MNENPDTSFAREREIFLQALEKRLPGEREAFLEAACGGDAALRTRVELLLRHHTEDDFLEEPAGGAEARPELGPVADEAVGTVIGRYKLREKIGEGGCGVVYVAEQEQPVRRRVALKVIKLGMDTKQVIARFEAERQALALMDHPNIARVLDAGATDTGRPYFVMELVRGLKITDYCDQNRLSTRERLELFIQVCRAIQHAHQKGIIHRDLKPSNILVTVNDGAPVPKVIDFGIAKATEGRLTDKTVYTAFEQFLGTPAYMSPEQAAMTSLDIDTRSDIYSLGVLLYELLTGQTPFDIKELLAAGLGEMRRTICAKEPLKPSTRLTRELAAVAGEECRSAGGKSPGQDGALAPRRRQEQLQALIRSLRGDLDWIVMKCLEKDRGRRYETANGLARDLERHLTHEPVVARPPSATYRARKFVRRHRTTVTAAAAVAAALLSGIFLSASQTLRATQASRQAEANERKAQAAEAREAEQRRRAEAQAYVVNLDGAQQAWEQNDVGRVRELLDQTAGYPGRGFEWYYWRRQTHLELKTFLGHGDVVHSAAFSPDGRRIVTGSYDHTAKVWDVGSGKELLTLKGHNADVNAAVFSPGGGWIATASTDGTARLWDAATGLEVRAFKGHSGLIESLAFSPDGQRTVTASWDRTARVWEAASGKELLTFRGHSAYINWATFSPDGRRIATGSVDGVAKVWEAASGKEVLTIRGQPSDSRPVAFSPDGQRLVVGSGDGTAETWDADSGRKLLTLKGHTAGLGSVAFSPDGRRIVTGSWDHTAKVWDAASGQELLTLKGHNDQIGSVAFSPDGQRIVTASWDHTAKVWDAAGTQPLTLEARGSGVWSVAISPDGRRLVTGSGDGTTTVWDLASGKESLTFRGHTTNINSSAFSPDGQRIATASWDKTAKVWEAGSGKPLLTLDARGGEVTSVAFSPDGQRLVSGSDNGIATVWDLAGGKKLVALKRHGLRVRSVAFSPDGRRILTGSNDKTAKVWDAASGQELLALKGHTAAVTGVGFSPDGRRLVTGSLDQTAKVWDAVSGQELLTLHGHSAYIMSVAFSPDGRRIVTGGYDRTAKVWEAATGKELLTLKGHTDGIRSVAFSPDGRRLVTGSLDQTARVWEAATVQEVAAWQEEERAGATRLAALRQEEAALRAARVRDPGAIKQWLVLAPIPFEGKNGAVALRQQQIPHEAELQPRAGDRVRVGEIELEWSVARLDDYLLDFMQISGAEFSVAYAVCYLKSDAPRTGLLMKAGSDDQAKIYLNGTEIYSSEAPRPWVADQDVVEGVELKAGINVLVFKVVNEVEDWQGSVRLTDAAGHPLKGISVTLTPP